MTDTDNISFKPGPLIPMPLPMNQKEIALLHAATAIFIGARESFLQTYKGSVQGELPWPALSKWSAERAKELLAEVEK